MSDSSVQVLRVVAIASKTGKYGGPFDTACRQAELATTQGMRVAVLAGALAGDRPDGSEFLQTRTVRKLTKRSFVLTHSASLALALLRATRRADVVHISYSREAIPLSAALFAHVFRRRLILQPHGMLTSRSSLMHRALDLAVTKRLVGSQTVIVALSSSEAAQLAAWHPATRNNIIVMGNPAPVGLKALDDSRPISQVALFAARLHARKRVKDFAAAAVLAAEKGWYGRYEVLGPDEGELDRLKDIAKRTKNLHYSGATTSEGVISRLQQAGVFVLPSANEPWGNVLVAALKMGVPVVVTESAVLAEVVREGGAGIVVNDESPDEIAAAVHEILSPVALAGYRRRARLLGESYFNEERTRSSLRRLYDRDASIGHSK